MNKLLSVIISFSIILISLLSGCNSIGAPSERQIQKDLSDNGDVIEAIDETGYFDIENIKITLADTREKDYEASIIVYLQNDIYTAQRNITVNYKYYDTGGWILKDVKVLEISNIEVIAAYPENAAIRNASDSYNNISLESHDTDLKKKQDVFRFTSTNKGKYFDYTVIFEEIYSADNGIWTHTETNIISTDCDMHQIDGIFYDYDAAANNYIISALHFDSISEYHASITYIHYDTNDRSAFVNEKGMELNFNPDKIEFKMDEYTIKPNEILRGRKTIETCYFYEKEWTRTECADICRKLLDKDRERHSEYSSDPSYTIKKDDLYGIWKYNDNQNSLEILAPTQKTMAMYLTGNLDGIIINIYGYDSLKKSYIAFSVNSPKLYLLEFVKDENGTISLKTPQKDLTTSNFILITND